jgi:beta-glucanase (GH16 family)
MRKLLLTFIVADLLAGASAAQTKSTATLPPPGYKLVWADEFNGATLDTNKWDYRMGTRYWSAHRPQNVSVSDGKLQLIGKKQAADGLKYTCGGIISKQTFKYGYYESRFKVPVGAGWHTSFWMMKNGNPINTVDAGIVQELDVCENDSVNLRSYGVNVHRWMPKPHVGMGHKNVPTPDLSADFQVWGCEFTPETVKYYFEGKLVQTVDAKKFPHAVQSIWLTMIASPLGKTKAVDDTKLPAVAEYDYVRFYEKN